MIKKKTAVKIVSAFVVLSIVALTALALKLTAGSAAFDVPLTDYNAGYRDGQTASVTEENNSYTVENEFLKLEFDSASSLILLKDKRTGENWNSFFELERLDNEPNELWEQNIKSLVSFSYVDSTKKSNDVFNKNNFSEKNTVMTEKIDNGFSVSFDFLLIKIKFTLNFQIYADELVITVLEDKIEENDKYSLISITPMPFFGSCGDDDEGYFLYPNGPGEIFYFKDISERQNSIKEYSLPIYSEISVDLETKHNVSEFDRQESSVMLPVFGVKKNNSAFVSIIESGDRNAEINITPGGVSVSANRINATFFYRNDYSVSMSGLSASGGAADSPLAQMYDKNMIAGDRKISYRFIAGEDADYSGMARAVRKNLTGRGILRESTSSSEMPVFLDLFMGTVENKMIYDEFISMTTVAQAYEMVSALKSDGVKNLYVNLLGLSKYGYNNYSVNMPFSGKVFSENSFGNLKKLCVENGYKLMVQASFANIKKGVTDFSSVSDPAKDQSGFVYTDYNEKYYLFNPFKSYRNALEFIDYAEKYNFDGIVFEDFGKYIYNDFTQSAESDRAVTAELYNKIIGQASDKMGLSGTEGGNTYVLSQTEILKGIPSESSNILFSDKTVPFYQMVVHGIVSYVNVPVNLFYDPDMQLLKQIEYGYIPYFKLTYEPSFHLRDTECNDLFNSNFENWRSEMVRICKEMCDNFSDINGRQMLRHAEINQDVYMTEYAGGIIVYVNYGDKDCNIGEHTVKAADYLIVR